MTDGPLSHVALQVATPAHDDRFSGDYLASLMNTRITLEHFGASFNWVKFPGSSDLCHARNKIFGEFLRNKQYNFLLKVDSDMGWEASDVVKMLSFNVDFIAGVGCKKKMPAEWCVSNRSDVDGSIETLQMQKFPDGTHVAQPNYVGAGFVLISRTCVEKLADAYKDLKYVDPYDKKEELALYDPVMLSYGERYFDDFAFCYRWRKIGGVVNVLPDIHLKHMGNYTFEGAWVSSLKYKDEQDGSEKAKE